MRDDAGQRAERPDRPTAPATTSVGAGTRSGRRRGAVGGSTRMTAEPAGRDPGVAVREGDVEHRNVRVQPACDGLERGRSGSSLVSWSSPNTEPHPPRPRPDGRRAGMPSVTDASAGSIRPSARDSPPRPRRPLRRCPPGARPRSTRRGRALPGSSPLGVHHERPGLDWYLLGLRGRSRRERRRPRRRPLPASTAATSWNARSPMDLRAPLLEATRRRRADRGSSASVVYLHLAVRPHGSRREADER